MEDPLARRRVLLLTALATLLSLGHHVDHLIRGNHVGWPLTDDVNAFTLSLGVYPTLALAVLLYQRRLIGPGTWALLSGNGALFVAALHFGPHAVEPPRDIIGLYPEPIGWFWFAWLLCLVGVLLLTCVFEVRLWAARRRSGDEAARRRSGDEAGRRGPADARARRREVVPGRHS